MSDRARSAKRTRRDGGFTLIEVLIVITMIGFLSATLAAVFSVIVRTTPDADARVTDARSLKGLVTWIPQDMDAAPPTGFDDGPSLWSCAGAAPTDSYNVVAMSWVEVGDVTTGFHASYRYELRNGSEWVIARYSCQDGGPAGRVNMTSELPAWSSSSPPAWVEMCSAPIDATTGDCPPASVVTDPTTQPVVSMKVTLTLLDGRLYTIDAAAKNPDENLADDPDAVTNYPPVAGVTTTSIAMLAGETRVLDLYTEHVISDPEENFLTSAVDSYEPMPAGITVKSSDPLVATITADPLMGPGPLAEPVSMIVSDAYGGSVDVLIEIEIVLPPNDPPIATTPEYYLSASPNESIVLPLDLSHGVSDPNGDGLSLAVLSSPEPVSKHEVGAPLGELEMGITVKPGASVGPVLEPIVTRITDDRGGWIDVKTFLTIVDPSANSAPNVAPFGSPAASIQAGANITLTVGATDPDGDLVWTFVDPDIAVPLGLTVTTSGLDVVVKADESIVVGTYTIALLVTDWSGATTPVTANIVIAPPPPPPPSPCVLGTLSVDKNPVGRSGPGEGVKALDTDVLVTLSYTGSCDGLVLKYDTGHPSGLGSGVGRVFPSGSPTSVQLRGDAGGGSEKWDAGAHVLTASTTSAVTPNSVSITLTVN